MHSLLQLFRQTMRYRNMRNHRTGLGDERTTYLGDLILPVPRIEDIRIRKGNPQRDGP
jgi:hypothetical protein